MNRIREGYCLVPNPLFPKQITRVSLKPSEVTAIVFWTRYPAQLVPFLEELDSRGYKYYFQYTITGYGKRYEKKSPSLNDTLDCFCKISEYSGPEKIIWRYDPIFFTEEMDEDYHVQNFTTLCSRLKGKCHKIVISFLDEYGKTISAFKKEGIIYLGNPLERASIAQFLQRLVDVARENGMQIQTCAELGDYSALGITRGHCIDEQLIEKITNQNIKYKKDPAQRQACGCMVSRDIGVNNTCLARCVYCYATQQSQIGKAVYDENFPALIKLESITSSEKDLEKPDQLSLF